MDLIANGEASSTLLDTVAFHLGWLGSVASLVSLIVSIWVVTSVRTIRESLNLRIRLPQIEKSLKSQSTALKGHVAKNRWSQAQSTTARLDSDLESLSKWIGERRPELTRKIGEARAKVRNLVQAGVSEGAKSAVMQVASDVDGIVQSVQHFRSDTEVKTHE